MNKISILIMLMLIIPVSAFSANIPNTNMATNTITLANSGTLKTHGVTFEKPITVKGYTSPYQVKILFDDNHTGYWSSDKFTDFIQDIENYFGANVTINEKMFNETNLNDYDIIIMPEFDYNLTDTEVQLLKNFVRNNGSLLVMGDNDYNGRFNYPETLNATTLEFGIGWADDQVNDETDNTYSKYYPYVHVWGNNTVADFLSNGKIYKISYYGTTLIIAGSNTSELTIYPIAFGDNDTTTYSGDYSDGNITYFIASDISNGGRVFASGSTAVFRTDNNYYYLSSTYDNKDFALRLIEWLMAEGLEISTVEYPTYTMKAGEFAYINMTIVNNENVAASNVKVSIEIDGTMDVLNSTQEFTVGTLAAGASKNITWKIMATGTSEAKIIVKVWSDNLRGFSKAFTISTKGFSVDVSLTPKYLLLGESTSLAINITNPVGSGVNASNVNITITLPSYITTNNDTFYHFDRINESVSVHLNLILHANGTAEPAEISINVVSENFGTASKDIYAYIFPGRVIVFYDTYTGYFNSYRFQMLLGNASVFRHVFVLDEPLTEDLLNLTDLVIMPDVDNPVPQEEAQLLANYVNNSGNLLMMGNYYKWFDPEYVNNITAPFGVTWLDAEIEDNDTNFGSNYQPVFSNFADNPYARFLTKGVTSVVFQGSTSFNTTNLAENAEFIPVILGNNRSYMVNATGGLMDISGSSIVAFALLKTPGSGWVALSGSSYAFSDRYTDQYAYNKVFIWNVLSFFLTTKFVYDTTPPTVNIVTPENNQWFDSKTFNLTWTASDNVALDRFEVYLNGALYDTLGASERSILVTVPSDGGYVVKVVAYDHLDYYSTDTVTVYVDSEAPTLVVTSPEDNAWYTNSTINVEWTLTDSFPGGLKGVSIYLDGVLKANVTLNATSYTLYNVPDGEHNLTVVARDAFHTISRGVSFRVDTQAPVIHGPNVDNGSIFVGPRTIEMQFNLTDNLCLRSFEILLNGSVVYTNNSLGHSIIPEGCLVNVIAPVTFDAPGTYIVTFRLTDCAGNVTVKTIVITIKPSGGGLSPVLIGGGIVAAIAIIGVLLLMIRRRGG